MMGVVAGTTAWKWKDKERNQSCVLWLSVSFRDANDRTSIRKCGGGARSSGAMAALGCRSSFLACVCKCLHVML